MTKKPRPLPRYDHDADFLRPGEYASLSRREQYISKSSQWPRPSERSHLGQCKVCF